LLFCAVRIFIIKVINTCLSIKLKLQSGGGYGDDIVKAMELQNHLEAVLSKHCSIIAKNKSSVKEG